MDLRKSADHFPQQHFNIFISTTYKQCVHCAVRADSLNEIRINFLQVSQHLAQSSKDCCEDRERDGRQADRLLLASCVPVLQPEGSISAPENFRGWFCVWRNWGATVPPNENISSAHTHTQNSQVLHFPVELKVLSKSRKGGNINCIVLYRVLFLSYLND